MKAKTLFSYFFLFIFLYEVNFVFIPLLTSKQIMEIIGFFLFVRDPNATRAIRNYLGIFVCAASLIFVALFSILINNGGQWMYHMIFVSTILNFFGAYFIYRVTRHTINSFDGLLKAIVICVLFQCTIAILFKAFPPLYNFAYSIVWSESVISNIEYSIESLYRLVGLGNAYAFPVLPTASLGMLSCAYLIVKSQGKNMFCYSIVLFYIICISFLFARTSLLLAGLSVFYVALSLLINHKAGNLAKFAGLFGLLISSIISMAIIILPSDMYSWAFEVFLNMQDGGTGTETGSGELLYSMVTETRFTPMTFVIGDAMYTDSSGGYYGSVDIGLYRQILYYGFIGLFFFLLLHFIILKKCIKRCSDKDSKRFFSFLFFALIIILMKGDIVLAPLYVFLLVMMDFAVSHNMNTLLKKTWAK